MGRPALGVQDDQQLLYGDLQTRLRAVAALKKAGVKDVRLNAIYGKTKGGTDWRAIDQAVNGLRSQGIRAQLTMMGDPEYNGPVHSRLSASHADPKEMGRFTAEAAKHFKGRVGRYEIGNEPNHPAFLKSMNPKEYRKMLDAGIFGVRSQDSKAQIIAGGLMPHDALPFLRKVVGKRALAVDGVSFHPYGKRGAKHRSAHNAGIADLGHVQQVLRSLAKKGLLTNGHHKAAGLYLTEDGTQASTGSTSARVRESAKRYGNARRAGAREYVQYQMERRPAQYTDPEAWNTSLPIGRLARRIARTR